MTLVLLALILLALVGVGLVASLVLWAMFLIYCAVNASRKSGKFEQTPKIVQWMSYMLIAPMWAFDVFYNCTFAWALFREPPSLRALTYTARLSSHYTEEGWRGDLARSICDSWIQPFEPGHCR